MSGERSTRMKGDGSREGLEFRVIGFEYNRGIERSRIRNASTILRAVVIRVHWSGQMQGGECVKCSLIWVKWGRVHRVAGMVCNAARERGYTVLERGRGIFGLDGDGRRKWGRKVREERGREYHTLWIHHHSPRLLLPIQADPRLSYRLQLFFWCGYRYLILDDFICLLESEVFLVIFL